MGLARHVKGVLFDFYQTLVEIQTDEKKDALWELLAGLLSYRGADAAPGELREWYEEAVRRSLSENPETYPEIDVGEVFSRLLQRAGVSASVELAGVAAQLFRLLSIERLELYPETQEVLEMLSRTRRLGLVSDSQFPYLEPELRRTSLIGFFEAVASSSLLGYRKPDPRLFTTALARMNLSPDQVVYVGDSWERDMVGARNAGIQGIWLCRPGSGGELSRSSPGSVPVIADLRELPPLLDRLAAGLC